MSKLPFKLEKKSSTTLINQIVNGFRHAIETGRYRPGDKLPPFRDIAQESGACMIVVREAFKRLAAEGLVSLRRGVGSIVLEENVKFWRGHIVIASLEVRENHLISAMSGALRVDLMKAGYLVSSVSFGSVSGGYDFSHLESVLRNSVTLVVTTSCNAVVDEFLSRFNIPYIAFGPSQYAVGKVALDCSKAVKDFASYCCKTGIKKVLEITVGSETALVRDALNDKKVKCETWPIVRHGGIEIISRATLAAFYKKMEEHGEDWLPDLLYFNDNFAAQNALTVLLESGVDIPGRVRFVTWSNAGEGPFWRKELTRIEIDPFEAGRIFARYVLKYLSGRKVPKDTGISPTFIIGES